MIKRQASPLCATAWLVVATVWMPPLHTYAQSAAGHSGAAKAELVSLQVTKPLTSSDSDLLGMFQPDNSEGVTLGLILTNPEATIIRFDDTGSVVTTLTDDQGTDLLAPGRNRDQTMEGNPTVASPAISDNGHACGVTVRGLGLPAPGTKSLHLKAQFAVVYGSTIKRVTIQHVKLRKGMSFMVGPYKVTLDDTDAADIGVASQVHGDKRLTFAFKSTGFVGRIKSIAFLSSNGSILGDAAGTESGSGQTTTELYAFDRRPNDVTIEASYYSRVERASVPVDMTIGLGL